MMLVRRADWALMALGWATIAASMLAVLSFGYGRDQGIYAVVARTVLGGGMPYRDAWDFKPPGIFVVYAVARATLGGAPWAIRVLEVAGMLGSVAAMISLCKRWFGEARIGVLAGALSALVHAQLDFWHSGQPETFGGMASMAALWLGSDDRARGRRWRQLGAGVLFGVAGLLKPPIAASGAALATWLALRARAQTVASGGVCRRAHLEPFALVVLGGVLPAALCLGWFSARGATGELLSALLDFAPRYTALGWQGRGVASLLAEAFAGWLTSYSSPIAFGVALVAARCLRPTWRPSSGKWELLLLAGIVVLQLVGVALQGKFFPYHYAACWPPSAMLAAVGWWGLWRAAVARGRPAALGFIALLLAVAPIRTATKDVEGHFWWRTVFRARVFLLGLGGQAEKDRLASVGDLDAAASRRLSVALARHVPRGDTMFVWGFEPAIYDAADRESASRYIYNVPQRAPWSAEDSRRALMVELTRAPPRAIVVCSGDALPMVTGDGTDSTEALEGFDALARFMREGYGALMQIDRFSIYLRR